MHSPHNVNKYNSICKLVISRGISVPIIQSFRRNKKEQYLRSPLSKLTSRGCKVPQWDWCGMLQILIYKQVPAPVEEEAHWRQYRPEFGCRDKNLWHDESGNSDGYQVMIRPPQQVAAGMPSPRMSNTSTPPINEHACLLVTTLNDGQDIYQLPNNQHFNNLGMYVLERAISAEQCIFRRDQIHTHVYTPPHTTCKGIKR